MRRLELWGLLLAAASVLAPCAARADSRANKYYYEDIVSPFFALDPGRPGFYRNQRPASKESSFSVVKAADSFRVFVLGGSIAGLLQYSGEKGEFAQALQAVLPGKKVEVINCGMAGYDSYREALIEQEILDYSPDLIVFLTGHNEGIASAPIPIWVMRAQERLSRLSAYRALVKTFQPRKAGDIKYDEAAADARDAAFERNLAENLRHARERGVPVAVVVPPRNYREPAEVGRSPYDAEFLPGWVSFLKGDFEGARRGWKASLESAPRGGEHGAFTWGFIARAEEKLGLLDEARASFDRAALLDRSAICGKLCQDILRRTAKSEGGFLVEADAMFRALAHPRAPGLETFNDRMHWKPRFNCLMSSELIAAIRAQPGLSALPWDEERVRALKASCPKPGGPGDESDDLRVLSYALMGLSWPDLSQLSTVSVFYLQAVRGHRPRWFRDVHELMRRTQNPQTQVYGIAMAPEALILPRFYWHIGEVKLLEKDYAGAERDLRKAIELDPSLSWARLSLAVAVALRGDGKGGLALLKEASERSRDGPGARGRRAGLRVGPRALDQEGRGRGGPRRGAGRARARPRAVSPAASAALHRPAILHAPRLREVPRGLRPAHRRLSQGRRPLAVVRGGGLLARTPGQGPRGPGPRRGAFAQRRTEAPDRGPARPVPEMKKANIPRPEMDDPAVGR